MQKYHALEAGHDNSILDEERKDRVLVLGALMMSVGANTKNDHMQYLRELAAPSPLHSPTKVSVGPRSGS